MNRLDYWKKEFNKPAILMKTIKDNWKKSIILMDSIKETSVSSKKIDETPFLTQKINFSLMNQLKLIFSLKKSRFTALRSCKYWFFLKQLVLCQNLLFTRKLAWIFTLLGLVSHFKPIFWAITHFISVHSEKTLCCIQVWTKFAIL